MTAITGGRHHVRLSQIKSKLKTLKILGVKRVVKEYVSRVGRVRIQN